MEYISRNIICKGAASMAFLLMSISTMNGAPAKPGLVDRYQSDGSVVKVYLKGDEHNHYILSEDGYPLLEQAGILYYAELDNQGLLKPSKYKATSKTAETGTWLARQNKEALLHKITSVTPKKKIRSIREKNPGLHESAFPHIGEPRAIVILVEYQDVRCTLEDPGSYFKALLNEEGFKTWGGTGSARDFFVENSSGLFRPEFDLYGPVLLPEKMAYYGANTGPYGDVHPEDMVVHACNILDPEVDFSIYDHDKDGLIDNVFVFYAGRGENAGGIADTVWPHSWDLRGARPDEEFIYDGVQLAQYACSNEWNGDRPDGIGTFVHEFSHVLGLPDLYMTEGSGAFTPGTWTTMDMGCYNNKSRTPSGYSIYERYALDWIEPLTFDKPDDISLGAINETNSGYIIQCPNPNEFFLIENRQQTKWDLFLPGHGMLVWHVDYDYDLWNEGGINNNAGHQRVDLLEADNKLTATTRPGDAFPGTDGITQITHTTKPSLKPWTGEDLETPITDIKESKKGLITFKVKGGLAPSETPVMLETSDIGSYEFTVNWVPVEDVTNYQLNIRKSNEEDPFLTIVIDAEADKYLVKDIAPETTYAYSLIAWQTGKGASEPSSEITVTTGEATFEWYSPVALEPTQINDTSFQAIWEPMANATEYFVTLFDKDEIITDDYTFDFTGGHEDLPIGWTCTTQFTFDQGVNSGESSPSLRMNATGATIESLPFDSDINSISFWHKGVTNAAGNFIRVSALVDDEWIEVAAVEVGEEIDGRYDTIDAFPMGSKAFRIYYVGEGTKKGPLAFDDLTIRIEKSFTKNIINGVDNLSAGSETSILFEELNPETVYYYVVKATDGKLMSRESKPIRVITKREGEVSAIDFIGEEIEEPEIYYNMQGIKVDNPAKGTIYIMKKGNKTVKILF